VPTSPLAGERLSGIKTHPTVQIALNEWPTHPALRGVGPEPLGNDQLESLAEEARKQAQTKYLAQKWRQPTKTVRKYVNLAWAEADKRDGLEPELLIAVMQKESSLRPKVQSRYGAQGLMQVVPRWHREKLRPSESLFDPEVNIRVGADVLHEYLELAKGSLSEALRKYSGNARGYANTVMKESRKLARLADKAADKVNLAMAAEPRAVSDS
jgi:soluble lytic murein transglycosylase-like protein